MNEETRFAFGENWHRFLDVLDADRVAQAERSLLDTLGAGALTQKSFLDVGSGSGLFSLAALRLGVARVHSVDVDPWSVLCATELRKRHAYENGRWTIQHGDILDEGCVAGLGTFDVVYCWGVLHHTGNMWRGLDMIKRLVAPGGHLCIAIYNDQGLKSRLWKMVKRIYNRLPPKLRIPYAVAMALPRELLLLAVPLLQGKPSEYVRSWTHYRSARGMSRWHDLLDWVGGYPFEVAKPNEILDYYDSHGFELKHLRTAGGGLGCNEFVLRRAS